jgi:Tol biopolymer transport system component
VPDAGYIGTDAIAYTVFDGRGGTASATYHLAVGNLVPNVAAITPSRGPTSGGQAVRITGSNFVFRSDAAFLCLGVGTLPLTVTALTDTEILATTPASLPGVCTLRVVTGLGRTGVLENAYTYEGSAPVDTDGDGVFDATDNCPLIPNPSQANADGDAQGDACDPDDDNDGQSDVDEVACGSNPLNAVSTAPDRDSDGRPDCVDPDDDNDGVADGSDNCPLVANASQADADHDGVGDACDPTPLPDRTIVFSRVTGSNYRIFKMQADGSNVTQLTSGDSFSTDRTPALSPDGRYVLFARWGVQGSDVYRIDVDGGNLVRLTGAGFGLDWDPTWSPDGTQIAFSCVAYICVMNADGSSIRTLAWHGIWTPGPAWSPDGTKIAFASFRFGNVFLGNAEILMMNADGSGLTRLTSNSAVDVGPTWSPDSAKIAFATLRHGNYEIYSMNAADGTGLMRLTNRPGYDGEPAWGANGQIVFTSVLGGTGSYLRKMNADGSGVTVLPAGIEPNW